MAPVLVTLPAVGTPLIIAVAALLSYAVLVIVNRAISTPHPKGVPLLREPPGATRFSLRTRIAYWNDSLPFLKEAYQMSKNGQPVLLPGLGTDVSTILPHASVKWWLSLPDSLVSSNEAFADLNQAYYTMGTRASVTDGWQAELVKSDMNLVLENLCAAMNEELAVAIDAQLGLDADAWREIDLEKAARRIVSQAASRFTVGLPLCRDEGYLADSLAVIDNIVLSAGIISFTPTVLQPIIGRLASLRSIPVLRKLGKHFEPEWRRRLEIMEKLKEDPTTPQPQDHLQMMCRFAERERPHELADLRTMTMRVAMANVASMHQTTIQTINILLDVLAADNKYNTVATVRDEVGRVMYVDDKGWTKAKVARMVRCDSIARETLRLHNFGSRVFLRKVMAEDGVVTDTGIHLPKNTYVSFIGVGVHLDDKVYEDAAKYDPFRFSREREAAAAAGTKSGGLSFVATSTEFLPFSHGKHSCPGRFLVDFELKMIISYVFWNYDVKLPDEYGGNRPPNRWITDAQFPPAGVKLLVKRRAGRS